MSAEPGRKVILVGTHVQDQQFIRSLGDAFKVKVVKLEYADFVLPGVVTIAFAKHDAKDFTFSYKRKGLIVRLEHMQNKFRNAYVFLGTDSEQCQNLFHLYFGHCNKLPPLILCPNEAYARQVFGTFSRTLTKEREKLREQQAKKLEEHFTTPDAAKKILGNLPSSISADESQRNLPEWLGTLRNIAKATAKELLDSSPLQARSCNTLDKFFSAVGSESESSPSLFEPFLHSEDTVKSDVSSDASQAVTSSSQA
eukprot:g51154.t1